MPVNFIDSKFLACSLLSFSESIACAFVFIACFELIFAYTCGSEKKVAENIKAFF